jgi:hypothetical protein
MLIALLEPDHTRLSHGAPCNTTTGGPAPARVQATRIQSRSPYGDAVTTSVMLAL